MVFFDSSLTRDATRKTARVRTIRINAETHEYNIREADPDTGL